MPAYRLLVHLKQSHPVESVSINLRSRDEALIVAQQYDAPAELWDGDQLVCKISQSSDGLWTITNQASEADT